MVLTSWPPSPECGSFQVDFGWNVKCLGAQTVLALESSTPVSNNPSVILSPSLSLLSHIFMSANYCPILRPFGCSLFFYSPVQCLPIIVIRISTLMSAQRLTVLHVVPHIHSSSQPKFLD